MEIRKATLDDVDSSIECLQLSSNDSEDSSMNEHPNLAALVVDDLVDFIIAIRSSVVLGFLVMKRRSAQNHCHHRHHHLSLLFVRPDTQGQGIGRSLWMNAVSSSKQFGVSTAQRASSAKSSDEIVDDEESILFTVNSSEVAIPFYSKLRFEVTGESFEKLGRILTPMKLKMEL